MPLGLAQQGLRLICQKIETEEQHFKPVIRVDTGLQRTTPPIFALAVCEHHCYLQFSPEELYQYCALPVTESVRLVSEKVRQHSQQRQGFLGCSRRDVAQSPDQRLNAINTPSDAICRLLMLLAAWASSIAHEVKILSM